MKEEWRDVAEFEGYYEVSNFGGIRRVRGDVGTYAGRILHPWTGGCGYKRVILSKDKNRVHYFVHRLVAAAFIGERPDDAQVNHKDGVKSNNHIDNLEYLTGVENMKHAFRTGIRNTNHLRGEKAHNNILTESNVFEIRELLAAGELTQKEIGKLYGVGISAISLIKTRRNWAWLK